MKKLLITVIALGSTSAFAQMHPWFGQHESTFSLAKNLPHLALVKSVYKDNFKQFKMAVASNLQYEEAFENIKNSILSKEINRKKVVESDTPVLVSAQNGTANYESIFKSTLTGQVLFTVKMTCVDNKLPPLSKEVNGEYIYYAAQDLYTCFAIGLKP